MLTIMALVTCGCCGAVWQRAEPYVDQWPASIAAGAEVPGLVAVTDAKRSKRAKALLKKIDSWYDQDTVTVLYTDSGDRKRLATAIGVTRFVPSPGTAIDNALAALSGELSITGLHTVTVGQPGGEARCGTGSAEGQALIVCGWADHGSLGVVVFTNRQESGCVAQIKTIRTAIIRRH